MTYQRNLSKKIQWFTPSKIRMVQLFLRLYLGVCLRKIKMITSNEC